jgi:hypothetical protein
LSSEKLIGLVIWGKELRNYEISNGMAMFPVVVGCLFVLLGGCAQLYLFEKQ